MDLVWQDWWVQLQKLYMMVVERSQASYLNSLLVYYFSITFRIIFSRFKAAMTVWYLFHWKWSLLVFIRSQSIKLLYFWTLPIQNELFPKDSILHNLSRKLHIYGLTFKSSSYHSGTTHVLIWSLKKWKIAKFSEKQSKNVIFGNIHEDI